MTLSFEQLEARWNSASRDNDWHELGLDEILAFAQQECIADLQKALAQLIAATELHHRNPLDLENLGRYNQAKLHAKQAIGTGDA